VQRKAKKGRGRCGEGGANEWRGAKDNRNATLDFLRKWNYVIRAIKSSKLNL